MTWKPIETAPRNKAVEVGGWYDYGDQKKWVTEIASRGWLGWRMYKRHYHTHWRELPEPPK